MSARGEWVELGGGSRGYYARPDGAGPFPSVVIYIEAYGLNAHFQRLTERFADAGFAAVTPGQGCRAALVACHHGVLPRIPGRYRERSERIQKR
jgi:hypothetical protein